MAGARSVLPQPRKKVFGRLGPPSKVEKEMVAQFVADQPAAVTDKQVTALAKTMRRSKEVVRRLIEEAKEHFQDSANFYVDVHRRAVEAALDTGGAKSLEVAVRGAQWAMENLSAEGISIIEKKQGDNNQGGKILIGINIGGLRKQEDAVDAAVTEMPPQET